MAGGEDEENIADGGCSRPNSDSMPSDMLGCALTKTFIHNPLMGANPIGFK